MIVHDGKDLRNHWHGCVTALKIINFNRTLYRCMTSQQPFIFFQNILCIAIACSIILCARHNNQLATKNFYGCVLTVQWLLKKYSMYFNYRDRLHKRCTVDLSLRDVTMYGDDLSRPDVHRPDTVDGSKNHRSSASYLKKWQPPASFESSLVWKTFRRKAA